MTDTQRNINVTLTSSFAGGHMSRLVQLLVVTAAVLTAIAPQPAEAVTVRDIIELSRAGLADEVLVALIETDGTVFTLTAEQLVELKQQGVSERVLVAMVRQGREPLPYAPAPAATSAPWTAEPLPGLEPQPPPVSPPPAQTTVVVVPTFVPYFIPYVQPPFVSCPRVIPAVATPPADFGRFINKGFPDPRPIRVWGPISTCAVR